MRVKNETRRWYCCSSSTIARSKWAEKMSRTTRTERSASWKTRPGAGVSLHAPLEHLVQLVQVLELALEVLALGAVGGGADDHPALAELQAGGLAAQARALAVLQAAGYADALAGGRVDHVAPGDRQLHRQAGALRLERVLDDLHDDLLAGFEQLGDLAPSAASAAGRLDARQHDLIDVQEAVLLEADVDEGRLEAGQDVVDLALVDVADDRAPSAALYVQLSYSI